MYDPTIFGSLSSKPASGARSLGDFSRTSNPPPSGGGEWDPSQGSETWRSTLDLESVLTVGIDVPVEGRRQMAEIDVAADPPLGPQPFDGSVHVDGVPGDDGIRDQV